MALESRTLEDFRDDAAVWVSRAMNNGWARPDWVSVNLTLKCNLACSFCKTCYPVRKELTTREIKDIIDQTWLWGVKRFNPIGGEPFVRQDLEEILAYACSKDFYITVTTNGTLITPERAAKIAQIPYNRLHFNFSIDGPNPWHDMGRGAGNFQKCVDGYRNLREADARAGNPVRKTYINGIINALNLSDMPDFLFWCRDELGVQGVQLLNLFRHGNRIDPDVADMWIPKDRLNELDDFVDLAIGFKQHEGDENFTITNSVGDLQNIKKYYRDELSPLDGKCYSGWKELYINADGRAIMCDGKLDFLNGAFGDVRRQTLKEMWTGPEIAKLRDNVKRCTTPCIQDCYLRRRSDSAFRIARGISRLVYDELKKRTTKRTLTVPTYADSALTLQLSDTPELKTSWDGVPWERFKNLTRSSPEPYEAIREDPFKFYDFRNRGYLNFDRGFLDMTIIRDVVEDAQRNGVRFGSVRLAWEGEPLLHPQVEEILRYLGEAWRKQPFCDRIVIPTRGTLLNHNYCKITGAEFGDVPFTWLFELDAYDKDSFLHTHEEQAWDRCLDNINFLLHILQEHTPSATRFILQDTITAETAADAPRFRDWWAAHLDTYGLSAQVGIWGEPVGAGHWMWFKQVDRPDAAGIREAREQYRQALTALDLPTDGGPDDSQRVTCAAYWKTPTISWDGKILLCTVDTQQAVKVGDANGGELTEQWWKGQRMHQIRKQVLREDFAGLNPCRGCNAPYSPNSCRITRDEVESYTATAGR